MLKKDALAKLRKNAQEQKDRAQKVEQVCRRICNEGLRIMGQAHRFLRINKEFNINANDARSKKVGQVLRRIMNSEVRLMGQAFRLLKINKEFEKNSSIIANTQKTSIHSSSKHIFNDFIGVARKLKSDAFAILKTNAGNRKSDTLKKEEGQLKRKTTFNSNCKKVMEKLMITIWRLKSDSVHKLHKHSTLLRIKEKARRKKWK